MNFLRSVMLFAEFGNDEIEGLRRALLPTRYTAGDVILEEGNANRALHIVKSGRIRVSRHVHDRDVPLCDLEAGQTFGELSIIEDGYASATLNAVSDSEVLSLGMDALAGFLKTNPTAASKFWRAIAIDLRRRILQTNDVVRSYFEMNQMLIDNPTFREAYAMCNR
ncbi:MAG: cyclic nucleotide-binding domain-containing protein [Acidobacteriota bacterium]